MRPSQSRQTSRDAFLVRFCCCIYLSAVPPAHLPLVRGSTVNMQAVGRGAKKKVSASFDGRPRRRARQNHFVLSTTTTNLLCFRRKGYRMQYDVLSIRKIIPWRDEGWGQGGERRAAHSPMQPCGWVRAMRPQMPASSTSQAGQQQLFPTTHTVERVARGWTRRQATKPTTQHAEKSLHARRILINCLLQANMGFFFLSASLGVSLALLAHSHFSQLH
ncbi:hypothetical protein MAPG_09704 [Magnaporthiopsis poae ATCC 64411]|uniref:Uncharacterized protein n=1 Tax=Magnaporthiopsis poae (strain ATCC 64411 / 73-15) TaxID=644358 RepID=A0A0C4CSJ5_MAGP6|nr:hypothetical protein, variant [Magnaporthiopsis poae ATCC 64411]KLU91182.1 hypothetical protein MAPG_09704 [Magnaporthiopsis poae ATCC 64411]